MCVIKRIFAVIFCLILFTSLFGCRGNLKGGELIIEEGASELNLAVFDVDTLNPLKTKSQSVSEVMSLVYEPLFSFDEKLNPVPSLAERIDLSNDGLSAKLILKKGISWHSGAAFSADDVLYTINEIKKTESMYNHNVKNIAAMERTENGDVILTLSEPVMNIEGLLSFPIIRNESSDGIDELPDGTGAFALEERSATSLRLTANIYREKSSVSAVNVRFMRNAEACLNAFEANELDIITSAAIDLGERMPAGESDIYQYTSNRMTFLGFNCTKDKYISPYLRLALGEIIDRERIVEKALFGRATVCSLPLNPSSSIYWETEGPEIDISGAFAKAGYNKINGIYMSDTGEQASVDILVSQEDSKKVAVADMISEQLGAEGVSATVDIVAYDEFVKRIGKKEYDIFVGEVTMSDNLCPDFMSADGNFFGYSDSEMSDAVYAMKLAKGDAFKEAMLAYERIFTVNPPFVPLYFANDAVVYKKNISGITNPNFYNNLIGLERIYFRTVK